jgi:hypothetical protein
MWRKESWFRGTFLAKLNPHATPRTVVIKALIGALGGVAAYVAVSYGRAEKEHFRTWPFLLSIGLVGALVGATFEWQMPPEDDQAS